jgi:ATP-dependent RNA helicase HelY
VSESLRTMRPRPGRREGSPSSESGGRDTAAHHPVASCPDLADHLRYAERADRLARDAERLERRIRGRVESLARLFDRVLRVLEAWGYLDGWALTEAGDLLARLYTETDLLVAESMRDGLLDGLDPPSLAAVCSAFTYESRGPGSEEAGVARGRYPNRRVRERLLEVDRIWRDLNAVEDEAGLPETRAIDGGFARPAHAWAAGQELEEVLADDDLTGGDFVRNVKQLIDLLRQIGDVAPVPETAAAARSAAGALFRGVVAASSAVGV